MIRKIARMLIEWPRWKWVSKMPPNLSDGKGKWSKEMTSNRSSTSKRKRSRWNFPVSKLSLPNSKKLFKITTWPLRLRIKSINLWTREKSL